VAFTVLSGADARTPLKILELGSPLSNLEADPEKSSVIERPQSWNRNRRETLNNPAVTSGEMTTGLADES
jgi:hypothetical protein